MKTQIDPSVRVGRFSARFAFHEEPDILERLEGVALENATSSASLVRLAIRQLLERVDDRTR